ncbi:MAG: hydantoinase/oxoprolinase family protein, partial [Deltaproteobacteria bacterium]|nr:hydantoinase/oxoprolinase family protein [Deltaproteobacteria bacterium]
ADSIYMMRGRMTEGLTEAETAHFYALTKPDPLVPRRLIGEVKERVDYKGAVVVELDLDEAAAVVDRLVAEGVTAVAVSLLWSIANDGHERALEELIKSRHPDLFVSLSSEVAPYLGEYERTITTIFNAYIGPTISSYLADLGGSLAAKGLPNAPLIMQAYGGVLDSDACVRRGVGLVESGPAAGVVGGQYFCDKIDEPNILVTDMGGTTFKVGLVRDGRIEKNYSPVILRHAVLATKIWVESIGAGGGSIGWVDEEKGLLKIGPQGAGAKPGPASYGLGGTEPTVSDVDLVLGYLNPDYFLGGRMRLDREAAVRAIQEKVADPLGMSLTEAASGLYRITNAQMADLIRRATVERGHDPRSFVLFVEGGAGPVHCGRYAAELGIKEVVVPMTSSVHGGLGLLASDVVFEYGKAQRLVYPPDPKVVNATFAGLLHKARADLEKMGFAGEEIAVIRSLDMRYRFQCHELNAELPQGTAELDMEDFQWLDQAFDELYEQSYGPGSGYREAGKEIITFRLRAVGKIQHPNIKRYARGPADPGDARKGKRDAYFEQERDFRPADIYDFDRLAPGMAIQGPCIVESSVTTIVVGPGDTAEMDEYRNIRMHVQV